MRFPCGNATFRAMAITGWRWAALLLAIVMAAPAAGVAQQPSPAYEGAAALGLELRRVGTTKRVLMVGAHPDDENTQLLSALALGQAQAVLVGLLVLDVAVRSDGEDHLGIAGRPSITRGLAIQGKRESMTSRWRIDLVLMPLRYSSRLARGSAESYEPV